MLLAAADSPSAGAPLQQILIASIFAGVTTAVLLTLIMRHRSGRSGLLTRAGQQSARLLGMEPWAALPFLIGTLALGSGAFGVFWDISLHIDTGRDPGPLANPSHYFILLALYGVFAAGLVSCALHERAERPSPVALRLPGSTGLSVPVGGALLMACGAFALTGFPLDDFWHRMFGQDVTLWGPTHLVMINGAILSVPVLAVLELAVWGLGRSVPAMPLFVVEALGIELVALALRPERSALRFGAAAGLLCGTVGFAAQYAWTQVWAPVPWTSSLLAEGLPTAALAGLAGGALGALLGSGLRRELPVRAVRRRVGIAAAVTLVALGANALWIDNPTNVTATVTLAPVPGGDAEHRAAIATVRFSDPDLAEHAELRQVLAWQGGKRVSRQLERVAPGVYRTDGAVPLSGSSKTNIRLQSGRAFLALPLHLPREPSIPTPGVVRPAHFTAAMVSDGEAMQTERRDYVPGWLWTPSALAMLLLCGLFVLGIAMGLARVAADDPRPSGGGRRRRAGKPVARAAVAAGATLPR